LYEQDGFASPPAIDYNDAKTGACMTRKRKSRTKYAILGFLASKPRSGYDLKKAIEKSVGFFWSESYGQIYPILSSLVEDGFAARLPLDNTSGRKRQQYAITDAGLDELQNWIKLKADYQTHRNEMLLKLFFGNQTGLETSLRHLRDYRIYQQDLNATFRGFKSTLPDPRGQPLNQYTYFLATLNYGIVVTDASIKWVDDTIRLLQSQTPE